jgi:hypothetical protein
VRIAGKEGIQFRMGGTSQPSEVGRVEALVRAPRIVVSAFTRRHVDTDITGARS